MPVNVFPNMAAILKEGRIGKARIEHFTVSKSDSEFTNLRAMMHRDAYVPPGTYARLVVGSTLMMSDTAMERRSNYAVVHYARGDVLIAGLGLGLIVVPILAKPEVSSVTVIEKYGDVVQLVEPQLQELPGADKLAVIEADIFDWKLPAGQKWDCIYFDIWPDITTDNLAGMARLHRKFARRKRPGGWMSSWKRDELCDRRDRERRAGW